MPPTLLDPNSPFQPIGISVPNIPVQPIGYDTAREIMKRLGNTQKFMLPSNNFQSRNLGNFWFL